MNVDRLNNLAVLDGAMAAMEVVNALQRHSPEARVVGAAAVFRLLAEHLRLDVQGAMSATSNLMNHADGRRPEFAAVSEYISKEL